VQFAAFGGPTAVWLGDEGLTLRLERRSEDRPDRAVGAVVRLRFGSGRPAFAGRRVAAAPVHVLRTDGGGGATFEAVRMRPPAWPGIEVEFRDDPDGGVQGALAYDLHVAPGADLGAARVAVEGAEIVGAAPDGGLRLRVPLGDGSAVELEQRPPLSWVEGSSGPRPLASRLRRIDAATFGFGVDGWDGAEPLVVDPGFRWATYLGGGASDASYVVRAAQDGSLLVGGWAGSSDFPTSPGAYRQNGALDAFVARLSADGSRLLWSTYIGGAETEEVQALDLAPDGSIVVGGWTTSPDFPTTPGVLQPRFGFGSVFYAFGDGFVARLAADGSRLIWSTYLGPVGDEFVRRLVVLDDGDVVVAGETNAEAFPTTPGVFQPAFGSGSILVPDVFVARLAADGSRIVWATYFGAFAQELLGGMAVAPDGGIVIGGLTASLDLPVTPGAWQQDLLGSWDAYVAKLSADGRELLFSTFLGGEGYDQIRDLAVDGHGEIFVAGRTATEVGQGFPVTEDAFQTAAGTEEDGFVARLSADGDTLVASMLLGGAGDDSAEAIAVDADGRVYVAGFTSGDGFPVTANAAQPVYGGGIHDGFVARFDRSLGLASSISYVGGAAKDQLVSLATAGAPERVVVAGTTFSADLPTTAAAAQPLPGGGSDALVVALDLPVDPNAGLAVGPTAVLASPRRFVPGAALTLAAVSIRNDSVAAVDLQALDTVLAASAAEVELVSLHEDLDRDGLFDQGEPTLAGPVVPEPAGRPTRLPLLRRLGPGQAIDVLVVGTARAGVADGTELLGGLADLAGVVARSTLDGRRAPVRGTAPLQGPTWIRGDRLRFEGDLDGDGRPTCRDVRVLGARLGETAGSAAEDADGDGLVSARDVDAWLARAVQRAPAWAALPISGPVRGGAVRIEGHGLTAAGGASASLDGRPLRLLFRDARTLVFEVPAGSGAGPRRLRAAVGGETVVDQVVEFR
jgi:hypothetical protein